METAEFYEGDLLFYFRGHPRELELYQVLMERLAQVTLRCNENEGGYCMIEIEKPQIEWNIQTYAITGEGDYQPCYMAGGDTAWVAWPDIDTVNTAKELIAQVLDGETITLPE